MTPLAIACQSEPPPSLRVPAPDAEVFESDVYPLLLGDCGFPACHGSRDRFFQVYGPGRTRLDPNTDIFDPPQPAEVELTYHRARSMLAHTDDVRGALLLRKPVEVQAGGSPHQGLDVWNQDVYADETEVRLSTLLAWALSVSADAMDTSMVDLSSPDADAAVQETR